MDFSHFQYGYISFKNWTVIAEKSQKARWCLYDCDVLKEIKKEKYKRTYEKKTDGIPCLIREMSKNGVCFIVFNEISS